MSDRMQDILEQVIRYMTFYAEVQEDGSGVFVGSPRPLMEQLGVSSGPLYNALYEMGFRREGRGQKAKWSIPKQIMEKRLGH